MERQPVRVLLVEDDEDDYLLTRDLLAEIQGNPCHLEWVKDYDAALAVMARNGHDIYLLDYQLGQRNGLELLRTARASGCRGPILLLTGQGEREVDLEAMKAGVADFLAKGRLDAALLERSIRYAVERQRDREALRQANDSLEQRVRERTAALENANAALREREESLREADRRKDEFLAMLAHELRNPLAPLRNALHIMKQPGASGCLVEQLRDMMERQVQHMTRMVDDLLDVSRITQGKIVLRKEIVDVALVVNRAVEASRPLIEDRHQELTVALPPRPVRLEADPTRLEQVLANLLNNAAKYTDQGGHIRLAAQEEKGEVVLRLKDTGMGLAADMLVRIFEPFVQSDRVLHHSQGGLGIGLTLVRSLVEMHGGTIQAHSDGLGQGSEFVLRLPALSQTENGEAVRAAGQGSEPVGGTPKRRILVVDDNVDAAESLAILLRLAGHDVRVAHDGPGALAAVEADLPDTMFLDIGMPVMNGYEVAQRLRQQSGFDQLLLVAMTGWGQDEDRHRSQEAGFDHHLVKPVEPSALHQLLASAHVAAAD